MYEACEKVHRRSENDETLWPRIEKALARSGDTGVDVDHYAWPLEFLPETAEKGW
jgi:hypothetical protein